MFKTLKFGRSAHSSQEPDSEIAGGPIAETAPYLAPHDDRGVLAYGLAWRALDGLGPPDKQARKLASKNGASRYTIVRPARHGVEPVVGLLSKTVKTPKGKVIESAAAVFSLAVRENAALYLAPSETPGVYLLVGLLEGLPSPEFDIVGSAYDVLQTAEHYQSYLTEGTTLYAHATLAGGEDNPEVDEGIANFIARNATVVRWVSCIPYESSVGNEAGGTLTAVGSSQMILMVGGGLLTAAGLVGGYIAYQDWSVKNSETAKAVALKAAALTSYNNSLNNAFRSAGTQGAAAATTMAWAHIQEQPTTRNGWRILSVTCTSGACEAVFDRTPASTFQAFSDSTRPGESPSMAVSKLNTASTTFELPKWQDVPVLNLEQVSVKDVTVPLGSQAQVMELAGLVVTITPPVPLGDSNLSTSRNVPVKKYGFGTWQIKGPVDTLLPAVTRLPPHSTLSSLKVTIVDNTVTYAASGRYFVSAN